MDADNLMIRNGIVHILDRSSGLPVLSDYLLEYDEEFYEFMKKQIVRMLTGDEKKLCVFDQEVSGFYQALQRFSEDDLIPFSQEIAEYFYQVMSQETDIPNGDLVVATCQLHSDLYLAILKLNYKETFVHLTRTQEEHNFNHIIKHRTLLPSGGKPTEAAVINLTDYSIYLTERRYNVNGSKTNYLSELVLQCHDRPSEKSKLQLVAKAIDKINSSYFENDYEKQMETKSILQKEIEENDALRIPELNEKLYHESPVIQADFQEQLERHDIYNESIRPDDEKTVRNFQKQFLTTDTGIEINIPMEIYEDRRKVEFLTNEDGTVSVLIKNIQQLTAK